LFHPLIKYAKHTQLWDVWLSRLSNQNYAALLRQSLEAPSGSRISCFYSLRCKVAESLYQVFKVALSLYRVDFKVAESLYEVFKVAWPRSMYEGLKFVDTFKFRSRHIRF